jgi:phosphate-selective porin OprO/OprP
MKSHNTNHCPSTTAPRRSAHRRSALAVHVAALTLAGALAPSTAGADAAADAALLARLDALEAELAALKETIQTAPAAAPKLQSTVVTADSKGLLVASADGKYSFGLTGTVHSDGRFYNGDREPNNDTFLFRRVRPTISGQLGELVSFRITPELAGSSATLLDAWADVKLGAATQLRVGQFKSPVGLERLVSASALPFVERTFPTELAANRDTGFQFQGAFAGGVATWALGAFNGAVDGRNAAVTNPDGEFELAGRLFFEPWRNDAESVLKGLGFGVAGSIGEKNGAGNEFLPRYRSASQETIFSYLATTAADGDHVRFSPQGYWYVGPFGLMAEYITSEQDVVNTATGASDSLENEGWQATASWVLTGEPASYKGVAPAHDFGWGPDNGIGAWEVLLRVGGLEIDDDAFPVFASAATAVESADTWAVGLNWYLSRNLKAALNYQLTEFEAGATADDRSDEEVIFSRLQFAF